MMSKAVFLDKDGTLIEDIPYNVDPEHIRLAQGACAALRFLQERGYRLIVVTNQSGVARGFFEEHHVQRVWNKIGDMLASAGIVLTDLYYCPHHPQGKVRKYAVECFCRKPQPGMLYRAALEHNIDLAESWMVGDILNDIEAGKRAGCRTVLIDNGHETEWKLESAREPEFTVGDLESAARVIVWDSLVRTEVRVWQEKTVIS